MSGRDAQWNMISGCTEASEGCANCWAKRWHTRFEKRPFSEIHLRDNLSRPFRWTKPKTIFVSNISDLFHPEVPDWVLVEVFATMLVSSLHDRYKHTFLICTKRAERMRDVVNGLTADELATAAGRMMEDSDGWNDTIYEYVTKHGPKHPLIWVGITAENQKRLDERAPLLFETKAARRWFSLEPLLEMIDALRWLEDPCDCWVPPMEGAGQHSPNCQTFKQPWGIDQVVCGGESGPNARQCNREWLSKIIGQCRSTGTKCYNKQLGSAYVDTKNGFGGKNVVVPNDYGSIRRLRDPKGTDIEEYPEDLRVRELAWSVR